MPTKTLLDHEVLHRSKHLLIGVWSNVLLVVWHQKPQMSDMDALMNGYQTMVARSFGGKFVAWVVIEDGVSSPDESTRTAISNAMDAVADHIAASLAVMEGSGFVAATARAVLTAMTAFSRKQYPTKFFSSVDEGAAWVKSYVNSPGNRPTTAGSIVDEVRRFRDENRT